MIINVEIIDEITQYEVQKNDVLIGSSAQCDIQLDFEGIGAEHIRITKELGKYYIEELASGEETILNGNIIIPGSKREFTSLFPVEIGGVLIHLEVTEVNEEIIPPKPKRTKKKTTKKKSKKKKKKKSIDPGSFVYLLIIVFALGAMGNFFINKKKVKNESLVQKKDKPIKIKNSVEIGINNRLNSFLKDYQEVIDTKQCYNNCFLKISEISGISFYQKEIGEKLYIGFDFENYKKFLVDSLVLSEDQKSKLEEIVNRDYNAFFSYDEFQNNNNKATFKSLVFTQNEYEQLFFVYALLARANFFETENSDSIKKVHLFTYSKNKRVFTIQHFLEYDFEDMDYLKSNIENNIFNIALMYNHALTVDTARFFKNRFTNSISDYDPSAKNEYYRSLLENGLANSIGNANCSEENQTLNLCHDLRGDDGIQPDDGVFKGREFYTIVLDLGTREDELAEKYKDAELVSAELRLANTIYMEVSGEPNGKKFMDAGKVFHRYDDSDIYRVTHPESFDQSRMVSEVLGSKLFKDIFTDKNNKYLQIAYKKYGEVKFTCLLKQENLSLSLHTDAHNLKKMLWRTSLPVYRDFIEKYCNK